MLSQLHSPPTFARINNTSHPDLEELHLLATVAKKHGTLRPCVDDRGLNAVIISKAYPIPLICDVLDRMSGAAVYTKLNLQRAHNLILIAFGDVGAETPS